MPEIKFAKLMHLVGFIIKKKEFQNCRRDIHDNNRIGQTSPSRADVKSTRVEK